jgi:hypothetical protein
MMLIHKVSAANDLQSYGPSWVLLFSLVNYPEAALAELANDAVAADHPRHTEPGLHNRSGFVGGHRQLTLRSLCSGGDIGLKGVFLI